MSDIEPGAAPEAGPDDSSLVGSVVVATLDRDVVVVSGPEAASYLHGQISADVEGLDVGQSTMSFLLEPRGRVEALFSLCRIDLDTFVIDTEPGFGEPIATSLERFKLRTKAEIAWHTAKMLSPRHGSGISEVEGMWPTGAEAGVFRNTYWPLAGGFDLLVPGGDDAYGAALGPDREAANHELRARIEDSIGGPHHSVLSVSAEGFELMRFGCGLPQMGSEIQPGDIPNETGLVELAASFTKGCYRGQELVERIDSRTGGRRSLFRLFAGAELAAGMTLADADMREMGEVRSAARVVSAAQEAAGLFGFAGFGRLRIDAADSEGLVYLPDGAPVEVSGLFEQPSP